MIKATRLALSGLLMTSALAGVPRVMMAASVADQIASAEARREALQAQSQEILDSLEEGVDLDDEQTADIDKIANEIEKIDGRIVSLQKLLPKGQGRKTAPEPKAGAEMPGAGRKIPATAKDSAQHGFQSMAEFMIGVRGHALGNTQDSTVQKVMGAATTYGNEGTGADGGFLVPPTFSSQLWQKVEAEENLMSRCSELTPTGNTMTIPKDETTPWGTAGLQAYWDGEAATISQSKGAFESATLRLHKLTALAPASEELLEDAAGFQSWIMNKVPGIMAHKINTGIVSGTGVGMPLGIIGHASVVSVGKEGSQPADTVWFKNINKMWARMYAPWRRNSIWLINQDIEPSLHGMAFQATGASSDLPGTSAVPAYLPMNGLSTSPYATLMGRPVVPVQACKTVGDVGDIILVDLQQYWILRKASGIKTDTSIHLYFDQAVTAFRFIFRINGQPAYSSTISPQNGSNTLSWAVTLDAR